MYLSFITCSALLLLAAVVLLGGVFFFLLALKLYVYFSLGVCKSKSKMNGKTALITGCTSGIGKETARDFAKRGARVIMACRNVESANKLKGLHKNLFNSANLSY